MTVQADFAATLVDEWWRCGVRHAVVSPGSRSSPLTVALLSDARIELHFRLDERSGAFFALGLAKATGRATLIVVTSGTAAAELHPAVVEADLGRVPLICCTCDRPFELHYVGASQTIDQSRIYGDAARFCIDIDAALTDRAVWRSMASRCFVEATAGQRGPGPVQANIAFREPLIESLSSAVSPGRADANPWHRALRPGGVRASDVDELVAQLRPGKRGLIIAGDGACPSGDPRALYALARELSWPVLADPRAFPRDVAPWLVVHGDSIFRSDLARERLVPDVVLHLGAPPVSRVLPNFFSSIHDRGVCEIVVDTYGAFLDPGHIADLVVSAPPSELALACAERLAGDARAGAPSSWRETFTECDLAVDQSVVHTLQAQSQPTEPGIAREVFSRLPADATLVVSASMPVRDIEWFCAPRAHAPRVVFNGGANGIDGVVSTTLGVAAGAASSSGTLGAPVVGLIGDLAFLHDLSGLVWGTQENRPQATFVVIDNQGSGIFSFLAQKEILAPGMYERAMATPQTTDCAAVARSCGCSVFEFEGGPIGPLLAQAMSLPGISVIVCRTDREQNRSLHDEIERAAVSAVDEVLKARA